MRPMAVRSLHRHSVKSQHVAHHLVAPGPVVAGEGAWGCPRCVAWRLLLLYFQAEFLPLSFKPMITLLR